MRDSLAMIGLTPACSEVTQVFIHNLPHPPDEIRPLLSMFFRIYMRATVPACALWRADGRGRSRACAGPFTPITLYDYR